MNCVCVCVCECVQVCVCDGQVFYNVCVLKKAAHLWIKREVV